MNYQRYEFHMHVEVNEDKGQKYYHIKRFGRARKKVKNSLKNNFPAVTDINKFEDLISFNIKLDDFVTLEIFLKIHFSVMTLEDELKLYD